MLYKLELVFSFFPKNKTNKYCNLFEKPLVECQRCLYKTGVGYIYETCFYFLSNPFFRFSW